MSRRIWKGPQRRRICLFCTFLLQIWWSSFVLDCLRVEGAHGWTWTPVSKEQHLEDVKTIRTTILVARSYIIRFYQRIQYLKNHYLQKINHFIKSDSTNKKFTVTVLDDFLTPDEAATLLQRYKPLLRESLHKTTTGEAKRSQYRTSHTVRLPPLGDPLVLDIQERAVALQRQHQPPHPHALSSDYYITTANNNNNNNNTISHVEDLQLACYGPHELYALHRDDNADGAADRSATVLIYLQAPTAGGATLFTNRPLEDERSLHHPQQPLRTEAAAVELFTHYCAHPRPHHTVVEAVTGRAVAWNSFRDDDEEDGTGPVFVRDSTHGACPIVAGEKCVVQQWMGRSSNPLLDRHVVALFTAGAAWSFRRHDSDSDNNESTASSSLLSFTTEALRDSSARRGAGGMERLQPRDGTVVTVLSDGPYENLGALRLMGGGSGLSTTIQSPLLRNLQQRGMTVSFWVRNLQDGTTLFSLKCDNHTVVSATHYSRKDDRTGRQVQSIKLQTSFSSLPDDPEYGFDYLLWDPEDWLWFTMSYHGSSSTFRVTLWDHSGISLGQVSVGIESTSLICGVAQSNSNNSSSSTIALELVLLGAPPPPLDERGSEMATAFVVAPDGKATAPTSTTAAAFVQRQTAQEAVRPPPHADVSFILVHDQMLELDKVRDIRKHARRYDVNL